MDAVEKKSFRHGGGSATGNGRSLLPRPSWGVKRKGGGLKGGGSPETAIFFAMVLRITKRAANGMKKVEISNCKNGSSMEKGPVATILLLLQSRGGEKRRDMSLMVEKRRGKEGRSLLCQRGGARRGSFSKEC